MYYIFDKRDFTKSVCKVKTLSNCQSTTGETPKKQHEGIYTSKNYEYWTQEACEKHGMNV